MKIAVKAIVLPFEGGTPTFKLHTIDAFQMLYPEAAEQLNSRGTCDFYTVDEDKNVVQIRAERVATYGMFGE